MSGTAYPYSQAMVNLGNGPVPFSGLPSGVIGYYGQLPSVVGQTMQAGGSADTGPLGTAYAAPPAFNSTYAQGLDLSTPLGINTYLQRLATGNASAIAPDPSLFGRVAMPYGTSAYAPFPNAFFVGGKTIGQQGANPLNTADSQYFSVGPNGYAQLTPAGQQAYQSSIDWSRAHTKNPSGTGIMGLLSANPWLVLGAPLALGGAADLLGLGAAGAGGAGAGAAGAASSAAGAAGGAGAAAGGIAADALLGAPATFGGILPTTASGGLFSGLFGSGGLLGALSSTFNGIGGSIANALGLPSWGGMIGSGLQGIATGAALGAGESALTGGKVGLGALTGGLTGGVIGAGGPALGGLLGIGTTGGDVLAGAGAGALGSELTGTNPLTGAVGGGVSGLVAGLMSAGGQTPGGSQMTPASPGGGPGSGAASSVVTAPSGAAAGGALPSDLTSTSDLGGITGGAGGGGGETWGAGGGGGFGGGGGAGGGSGIQWGSAGGAGGGGGAGLDAALHQDALQLAGDQAIGASPSVLHGDALQLAGDQSLGAGGIQWGGPTASGSGVSLPAATSSETSMFASGAPAITASDVLSAPATGGGMLSTTASPSGLLSDLGMVGSGIRDVSSALGLSPGQLVGGGVAGLGLLHSLMAPTNFPQMGALQNQANILASQGGQLESYITSGTLPPGEQTGINNATQAAIEAIKGKYASMGMTGSTMEQQEINQVNLNAQATGATLANQLLGQGINETQLSTDLYTTLLQTNLGLNQQTGSAISALAAALAGGPYGGLYSTRPAANATGSLGAAA